MLFWRNKSGPHPGFPVRGGADLLGGGVPTYDFVIFSEKLHEIKKIFGREGWGAPPNPPLQVTGGRRTVEKSFGEQCESTGTGEMSEGLRHQTVTGRR